MFPDRAALNERKATMGDALYSAIMMQNPISNATSYLPDSNWGVWVPGSSTPHIINIGIDFASGKQSARNDYTAAVRVMLMDDGRYCVDYVYCAKPPYPVQKQLPTLLFKETYERWGLMPIIFIEDKSAGEQILQEYEMFLAMNPDFLVRPIAVMPTQNKAMRVEAIAQYQNTHLVDIIEDAPWHSDFVRCCADFPLAEHDDMLDAYVWAQAGFSRPDFFRAPAPTPQIVEYDCLEQDYESSFKQENHFDAGEADFRFQQGQIEAYYSERLRRLGHR